jgi:ketosteroid isomerase-like protein
MTTTADAPTGTNISIIQSMYAAFMAGDLDRLRNEIFHPQIKWFMPGHHPLSGLHDGVDQVMAFNTALSKGGITVDNVHLGELDDGSVVERHTGHGAAAGETFLFPTCTSYRIQDGKIFEVRVHTNDPQAVDRYMWLAYPLKPLPDRLVEGTA